MPRRVWKLRPAGLPAELTAPYWQGERAEQIVAHRVAERRAERAAKLLARRSAKGTSPNTSNRATRPRTTTAQIKRLERALIRRKTLVARQRVQAQLDALRAELAQ